MDFNGNSNRIWAEMRNLVTRESGAHDISETALAFSRLVTARTQANANTDAFKASVSADITPRLLSTADFPQIHLNDSSSTQRYRQVGANDWLPTKEYNNVWDFIQNVSVIKGSHSMKFGAEFRPIQFPFFQVPYPHGEMNFNQNETAYPSTVEQPQCQHR